MFSLLFCCDKHHDQKRFVNIYLAYGLQSNVREDGGETQEGI